MQSLLPSPPLTILASRFHRGANGIGLVLRAALDGSVDGTLKSCPNIILGLRPEGIDLSRANQMTSMPTDECIALTDRMHLLVGRLFDQYGQLESQFTANIKSYMLESLGSDWRSEEMEGILRLVVSSFRMSTSKDAIKQFVILRNYNRDQINWISRGLDQAREIGFVRDRIAHNGVRLSGNNPPTMAIGNNNNVKDAAKAELLFVPFDAIHNATIDLLNIGRLISNILGGGNHSILSSGPFPCDESDPWRYKSSVLTRRRQRSP